jgi:hypothetical protein
MPKVRSDVDADIIIRMQFQPGDWLAVRGTWSITNIVFRIVRSETSGNWVLQIGYDGFRGVTKPDHAKNWRDTRTWPGFSCKADMVPDFVITELRRIVQELDMPTDLPPLEVKEYSSPPMRP